MAELNTSCAPFAIFGINVFGHQNDALRHFDEPVLRLVWAGADESQKHRTIGRSNSDESRSAGKPNIHQNLESQLFDEELLAYVMIANK